MPRPEAIEQEFLTPTYERSIKAAPDQVGHIRREVAAFAERAGASPDVVDNVRLAVTEACTNVVVHAYRPGDDARLLVRATADRDGLEVSVRDWGGGFQPGAGSSGLGLGLPLLHALAQDVQALPADSGGVEVRMRFGLEVQPPDEAA